MNFSKNTVNIIFLLIIFTGLGLRGINLTVGFPMLYLSNDEAVYHFSALNMIANKTLFTLGNYGPLGSYIQIPFLALGYVVLYLSGKVDSIAGMQLLLTTQEGYFLFVPRIISALFGTLTILSTYKISLELFKNKYAALWSGFLVAVSFSLVHVSHLARPWSPALLFSSLTILFAIKSIDHKRRNFRNTLIAFVFSAIAFGFHQITGLVVIFLILVYVKKPLTSTFSKKYIFSFSTWIFLIIVFNYLSLGGNIFQVFGHQNTSSLNLIRSPSYWFTQSPNELLSTLVGNLKVFWNLILAEGLILLLALYGFFKEKIHSHFKIGFIFLFITNIFLALFIFPAILRYLLPSIVLLPIFAGIAMHRLLKNRSLVFVAFIIFLASFNSIYWNYLITRTPTFMQMRQWLDNNIDAKTPIASTSYRKVGYVPSAEASEPIRKFRPGYYMKAANLIKANDYPYNVRNILYLESFNRKTKLENLDAGLTVFPAEYIIDAYFKNTDRLLDMRTDFELIAHFSPTDNSIHEQRIPELFFDSGHVFPLFILDRPGPYFDIIKIK